MPDPSSVQDFGFPSKAETMSGSNHNEDPYSQQHSNAAQLETMERISRNMSISGELFEKLYLSPKNPDQKGDLRMRFANPTPVALIGFLMATTPAACDLMGWRGSGALELGAANNGAYWWFGGLLMILGGLLEFFLGNTFSWVVFSSFGAYWMTYGATLTSQFDAFTNYAQVGETSGSGADSPVFLAAFGFFLVFMGLLCLIYLICSIRTNIIFFVIFLVLVPAFGSFAGAFWQGSLGNIGKMVTLLKVGGAGFFVAAMAGWYLFAVQVFASVDLVILPVGDLSHIITPASERALRKEESEKV